MGRHQNLSKKLEQRLITGKQRRYNSTMKDLRTDNHLLEVVAQKRDQAAFLELFDRYGKNANALAYHITGDRDLAEEATQEGMLNVWVSAHTFRSDGVARKWVLCIVANAANQILRSRNREKIRIQKRGQLESSQSDTENMREALDEREGMLEVLRQQTLRLPLNDRKLLSLYYGAELSQHEIGEMLSMPQRTVSHRLKEALALLRENIGRAGYSSMVALFTDTTYREALLSGVSLGSDVSSKLMDVIHQMPSQKPVSLLVNERPVFGGLGRGFGVLITCCAFFAVGAGGVWLQSKPKGALDQLKSTGPALKGEGALTPGQLSRTWVFTPENPPAIRVIRGRWHAWIPGKKGFPAGVLCPSGPIKSVWFSLPVKIPKQPFVVSVSLRVPSKEMILKYGGRSGGINGFLGTSEAVNKIMTQWVVKNSSKGTRHNDYSLKEHLYFKGKYQVLLRNEELIPLQIIKFKNVHPYDEFRLGVHGYVVESVSIQSFTEEAFPINAKKWTSFTLQADSQPHLRRLNVEYGLK